jgi:sialate O-acetylesterase
MMSGKTRRRWLAVLTFLTAPFPAVAAELEVAVLFGDHMVVQRDDAIVVWGTADPDAEVTVALAGRTQAVHTAADGTWQVRLDPLPAGGPHRMSVASGAATLWIDDVLVGDVWVCSGQSNMEWIVADSMDAEREIAESHDSGIRHFKVPRSWAILPETTLAGGVWELADSQHAANFTAVGYFFARELRRHVDVPIGLINTTWGGSRIEPWMSAESLAIDEAARQAIVESEAAFTREVLDRISRRSGGLPEVDRGLVDGRAVWADPELDDTGWMALEVPSRWEEHGYEGMDGVVWYRTEFDLDAAQARAGVRLGLGTIDDSDISWVNGREVGRTILAWNRPRVYDVPPGVLRTGRNVIAVRVEDTGGGGGIWGDPDLLYIEAAGVKRPLAGTWRIALGLVTVNADARKNQVPTMLYNKMVHPLLPHPVAGFLWYQGESNADTDGSFSYRELFATMITDWRARWGRGDLPFLWVQLANYMAPSDEPGDSDWAVLRESQSAALSLPNTAQAVTIDIGDADDIHPRNKQEVGRRLALGALAVAYGQPLVYSGPVYRTHEVKDGRVVLEFDHVGGGLVAKGNPDGRLAGFAVAGPDRRFVWAHATIVAGRVAVWSDDAPEPVAVRYAWADNPDDANLYNAEGLPASPFRTDSW